MLVINPDGLANQTEGGIIQAVSWALKEAVQYDRSGILTRDWASYPILGMPEAPAVEIELIDPSGRACARCRRRCAGTGGGSRSPMPSPTLPAGACAICRCIRRGSRRCWNNEETEQGARHSP